MIERSDADPRSVAEALRLATQVNRLSHLLGRPYVRDHAPKTGLSLTEWRVFVRISQHPDTTAAEIAAATGLTSMTVSRAVHKLRGDDLVEGEADPADSRRALLRVTSAGRALFEEIAPDAARNVGAIMAVLSPEELAAFRSVIDRVIAAADLR